MVQTPASSPRPVGLNTGLSWNPLVISLVVTICVVFLVLSYFTILKQMFRGFSHSTYPTRHRLNEANPSLQFHSHGLDSSTVKSLPLVRFDEKKGGAGKGPMKNTECAVCLGEFGEDEQVKLLPYCCHSFHISCIDEWFQCHSTCPICRSEVVSECEGGEDACSISVRSLIETMRREDGVGRFQSPHFEILRSATSTELYRLKNEQTVLINPILSSLF